VLANKKDPSSDIDGSRDRRMIQWMCGHMKLDRIRNEVIRNKVKVIPIEDKMREIRLRWFSHLKKGM